MRSAVPRLRDPAGHGSVDAFGRFLEVDERPLSLQLSPQADRPPLEPALLLEAIVFDQPLDASEPSARVRGIRSQHAINVLPTATPTLSSSAHYGVESHRTEKRVQNGNHILT